MKEIVLMFWFAVCPVYAGHPVDRVDQACFIFESFPDVQSCLNAVTQWRIQHQVGGNVLDTGCRIGSKAQVDRMYRAIKKP